jgi:hypothetical protein
VDFCLGTGLGRGLGLAGVWLCRNASLLGTQPFTQTFADRTLNLGTHPHPDPAHPYPAAPPPRTQPTRRAHSPEDGRLLQCLSYHRDQVTCLAVSGGALAAGCQMGVCVGGIGGGIGGGGGGLEAPRLYFPLLACARLAHLLPLAGRPG